jgi:hypothetical protein
MLLIGASDKLQQPVLQRRISFYSTVSIYEKRQEDLVQNCVYDRDCPTIQNRKKKKTK